MLTSSHRSNSFLSNVSQIFGLSATCLFAISLCASGDFHDSVTTSLIVAVQTVTGALVWIFLQRRQDINNYELIGMGFSIGSLLVVCSSQILRNTSLVRIGWLIPTILILFIFSFKKHFHTHQYSPIEKSDFLESGLLICVLLLSLTYWWFWLWPIIALLALILIIKKYAKKSLWFVALSILTSLILVSSSLYLKGLNTFWRVWSHDQIFLEAMSYSAAKWGPAENIHSVGIEFKYHWLSLAWSGATAAAANSEPLFITTITLPVVALFSSILILYAITKYLTSAKYLPLLVVTVFVFNDNFLNTSPVRLFHSPTYLFALTWMFGFVFTVFITISKEIRFGMVLSGTLLIAAFGGKVSHGIVLAGGIASMMVYLFWKPLFAIERRLVFNLSASLTLSTLIAYLFLYRGMSIGNGEMLSIEFGRIGVEAGLARNESGWLVKSAATATVLFALSPVFLVALNLSPPLERKNKSVLLFVLGSGFLGLLFTSIFNQDFGGQIYFAQSALAVAPIAIAVAINRNSLNGVLLSHRKSAISIVLLGFVYGVVGFLLWDLRFGDADPYLSKIVVDFLLASGFLLLVVIAPKIATSCLQKGEKLSANRVLRLILVIAFIFSVGLTRRVHNFLEFASHKQLSATNPNLIYGSIDHNEALSWLRTHSDANDIVATNRFCIPEVDYCNPKWTLVSALSQRRMLIEGYSYGQIRNSQFAQDPSLPDWAKYAGQSPEQQSRLKYSLEFAETATKASHSFLISRNVTWVVVDHSAQKSGRRDWNPWGFVKFQNSTISIIELTGRP